MKCKICNKETTIAGIGVHTKRTHKLTLQEYYDKYYKHKGEGTCKYCNAITEYINFNSGYKSFCDKCSNIARADSVRKTKLDRYGDSTYNNTAKIKQTKLDRYGDASYNNRVKAQQTMDDLYGGHYASTEENKQRVSTQSKKTGLGTDKFKDRMIELYGVDNYNKLESQKERLKLYGKQYGFGTGKFKKIIKEKYGVDNISQLSTIKDKKEQSRQSTIFNRYITNEVFKRKNVIPLFTADEYTTGANEYKFKCTNCDIQFNSNMQNGTIKQCPSCYNNRSSLETIIIDMIIQINPDVIIDKNCRSIIPNREIDIFLPEYNIGIEVNGLYWHNENHVGKNYHLHKTQLAEEAGVHLIHIWEDDIIYKLDILEHRLRSILNRSEKIGARLCHIREITSAEKRDFLLKYHIQGNCNSSIRLGAFYNGNLVGVMTFGKLRKFMNQSHKDNEYEMYRFATSFNVIGLASKMLKYFITKYNPYHIISYADRSWTTKHSNVYQKIGFTLLSETVPDYYYVNRDIREHRYKYRKSNLKHVLEIYDDMLSERANMERNGYYRIYGPGSLKYSVYLK